MASEMVVQDRSGGMGPARDRSWSRRVVIAASAVALALLGSFYSIVASAVDRGERQAPAIGQSDIDEDLRTPSLSVLAVGAAPSR